MEQSNEQNDVTNIDLSSYKRSKHTNVEIKHGVRVKMGNDVIEELQKILGIQKYQMYKDNEILSCFKCEDKCSDGEFAIETVTFIHKKDKKDRKKITLPRIVCVECSQEDNENKGNNELAGSPGLLLSLGKVWEKYVAGEFETKKESVPLDENRSRMISGWRCDVKSHSQKKWFPVRISDHNDNQIYVEYDQTKKWLDRTSPDIANIINPNKSDKNEDKSRRHARVSLIYNIIPKFTEEHPEKRSISKYTGRIKSKRVNGELSFGTGTVFDYDNKTKKVFVITSAHNFMKNDEKSQDFETKIYFQRISQSEIKEEYYCAKVVSHQDQEHPCPFGDHKECPNNVAILIFEDKDAFYQNIFKNNSDDEKETIKFGDEKEWKKMRDVEIYSSDKINDNFYVTYSIFGYEKNLRLLETKSECNEDTAAEKQLYFKKINGNKLFAYNCIDTTPQQIGGAVVTEFAGSSGEFGMKGDKYGIVGIHTESYGENKKGYGIALNHEKIAWINYVRQNAHLLDASELRSLPSNN